MRLTMPRLLFVPVGIIHFGELRVSNNPDRTSQMSRVNKDLREMSNSSELQAANRSEVTNSIVVLVKGKKTKLGTKESAHKITSPLPRGESLIARQNTAI